MYRRNYESTGYAPFDQINTGNVGKLKVAFDYQSDLSQGHEAAPDGQWQLSCSSPRRWITLIAMDATSGKVLWKYDYPIDQKALKTVCCDVVNRGVALYGDLVYMGTLGNHIVALEATSGEGQVGYGAGSPRRRLFHLRRAAGRQRQGDHRRRRRRVRGARFHRRHGCRDREGRMEDLHDSRARNSGW